MDRVSCGRQNAKSLKLERRGPKIVPGTGNHFFPYGVMRQRLSEVDIRMMVDKIQKKSGGARRGDPNEAISRKLKLLYSAVEGEGIPDRFLDLLEKLDLAESASSVSDDAERP